LNLDLDWAFWFTQLETRRKQTNLLLLSSSQLGAISTFSSFSLPKRFRKDSLLFVMAIISVSLPHQAPWTHTWTFTIVLTSHIFPLCRIWNVQPVENKMS
jgi:hypothetical protein